MWGALGSPFSNLPPWALESASLKCGEGGGGSECAHWGGGGGAVGTPTCIPQNDPHGALIILNILNIHKWGSNCFKKKISTHPHTVKTNKIGPWTWEPIVSTPPSSHPEQISGCQRTPGPETMTKACPRAPQSPPSPPQARRPAPKSPQKAPQNPLSSPHKARCPTKWSRSRDKPLHMGADWGTGR